MSKLYFRYGAMNSGKSTGLLQVAHNYEERGMKVLLIKASIDSKGGNTIVSRLGVAREVDYLIGSEDNVFEIINDYVEQYGKIDCLLVDEVQFMKKKQIDQLFEVAVKLSTPTICYGLRTDFRMEGFEGSKRLLLLAHSIEELKTICRCGKKALLNGRMINDKFIFEGEQVAIDDGTEVEYRSLCPKCYYKLQDSYFNG